MEADERIIDVAQFKVAEEWGHFTDELHFRQAYLHQRQYFKAWAVVARRPTVKKQLMISG
jgi:hypothetical protein